YEWRRGRAARARAARGFGVSAADGCRPRAIEDTLRRGGVERCDAGAPHFSRWVLRWPGAVDRCATGAALRVDLCVSVRLRRDGVAAETGRGLSRVGDPVCVRALGWGGGAGGGGSARRAGVAWVLGGVCAHGEAGV